MRVAFAALLFIAACGGGSVPVTGTVVPVTSLREDLRMGYFAGDPLYLVEQADHVNLWFARADTAPVWHLAIAEQLQAARGAGIKNVVLHVRDEDPVEQRFQLGRLSEGGWLTGWDSITLYKWDEPDTKAGGNLSEQEIGDRVTRLRQVALDTPGLAFAKIGVFYQCESGASPGIRNFDLVGCYRYESSGCAKLESDYERLRSKLAIGSRLWVIPGGATINDRDGHQDPACWASYAHRKLDVWGVIPFMWQSGADPHNKIIGIRENGLRALYCEMGRTILKPHEPPRC